MEGRFLRGSDALEYRQSLGDQSALANTRLAYSAAKAQIYFVDAHQQSGSCRSQQQRASVAVQQVASALDPVQGPRKACTQPRPLHVVQVQAAEEV